ncbi:MAG TPA: type II toxin-antitoxin system VapC family toxin [Gemmatimonadales bacterium]|nr:type II toxin-antitoxin system VapC family toxin [Gemmatimonadales bacterium]
MTYLLDTNIISDIARRRDEGLLEWAGQQNPLDLHLSVLTLGEIQQGIVLLGPEDARRTKLEAWLLHDLPAQFAGRLLVITEGIALNHGELAAQGKRTGRPLPVIDGLLLATARTHGLTLVTRNMSDTEGRGVPVLNPYTGTRPNP